MLHFSCNSCSPLLTCQLHQNNDCSPRNTSVQYLRQTKPCTALFFKKNSFMYLFFVDADAKVRSSTGLFVSGLSFLL